MSVLSPSTPSGAKPTQIKKETPLHEPRKRKSRKNKTRIVRKKPEETEIDRTESHPIESCPVCGESFENKTPIKRSRVIVDIIIPVKHETVKHEIDRCWCSNCRKYREPVVTDALPGFTIGLKAIVYGAHLHYGLGMSISKVLKTLRIHGMTVSAGELINAWAVLARLLRHHYDGIRETVRNTKSALYADETGHRQNGKRFWLWIFATKNEALFLIRKKRSAAVVLEVLGKEFGGILVTDFWKPYLATIARFRQWCVAHLLREFKKIEFRTKPPPEYYRFRKKVLRLFRDALSFSKTRKSKDERFRRKERFLKRLTDIVNEFRSYADADIQRLVNRLDKYRDGLFTFVSHPNVDATNNHGERTIRFAVIARKVQFHTMSDRGSFTMETMLTIFRTLEMRGLDPYAEFLNMARAEIENSHKNGRKERSAA